MGLSLSLSLSLSLPVYAQESAQIPTAFQTTQQESMPWPWVIDPVYWPLSSAIAVNGLLVGAALGGEIQHKLSEQGDTSFQDASIGVAVGASVGAGSALLGTWLLAPTLSTGVAHPAQAASIGSGIMWGTLMGVETLLWNGAAWTNLFGMPAVPVFVGGMAGGLIAAAIPAPMSTGQVGVRNMWGLMTLTTINAVALRNGCAVISFGRSCRATPTAPFQEQAAILGAQTAGLILGDIFARSGDYDDWDAILIGGGALGGFLLGSFSSRQLSEASATDPVWEHAGMYIGAVAVMLMTRGPSYSQGYADDVGDVGGVGGGDVGYAGDGGEGMEGE